MPRRIRPTTDDVEPLGLDPQCQCLICRAGRGDRLAIERLVGRLVDVIVISLHSCSDADIVTLMETRARRSAASPLLVNLVLQDIGRGSPIGGNEVAAVWIIERLHDPASRREMLEAIVDVWTELSAP